MINREILEASVKGASKGCVSFSAASIASGAAMVSVPVKMLGVITVGTSTVVSVPVVAGFGLFGSIAIGGFNALMCCRKARLLDQEFADIIG